MYQKGFMLFMTATSPVHWGTGTSYGVVDLPVQRERHTGYPMAQAAGIKGSLREHCERGQDGARLRNDPGVLTVFGPSSNASEHAGAATFGDGRLILFPVRSLKGTYALCTSPLALSRLKRDLELVGVGCPLEDIPTPPDEETALVPAGSTLKLGGEHQQKIVLDESCLKAREDAVVGKVAAWLAEKAVGQGKYFQEKVRQDLVLLPETTFRDVVTMSTVVETHVAIDDETGVASDNALFNEEVLPPECLLSSIVLAASPFRKAGRDEQTSLNTAADVMSWLRERLQGATCQMGADATTGRGIMQLQVVDQDERKGVMP